ncbi:MAG: DUF6115 domain-containing protein [Lachnospiraceae bacterium]|nr:DUF6115 domain-containing protein [Agathobacter sp.]MDD6290340.1 DUF6115 domain-containing protein [Lachnospiraceae bacterium]
MTGVEVTLILIGIILIIGSFFVQEKLSPRDVEEITRLSEKELKVIVERQLKAAGSQVEEIINQVIEETQDSAKRSMEKETNEKIMAISEYSNTVIESMNKTHNEILFLYNMLNDKHVELTDLASRLQQFSDQLKMTENEMLQNLAEAAKGIEQKMETVSEIPVEEAETDMVSQIPTSRQEEDDGNHNERILQLRGMGMSDVEIARALGLGLGEVRLVIGLYKGEETGEI